MINTPSEPVKILHLHTRAIVGGSGTNVLLTLEGLPEKRFRGELACGSREVQEVFIEILKSKNIKIHFIPHLVNRINPFYECLAFFEIIRLIKRGRYTIVHTHNSKAGILGRLAARLCGVPIIIHTIHSCEFNYEGVGFLEKRFFILLEKWAASFTDCFIAISRHIREEFIKYRIADGDNIKIIVSGIDIEKFQISFDKADKKKELGIPEGLLVVGTVARMEKGKGYEYLLKSAVQILQKRRDILFLWVGDGPLKRTLEGTVISANIKNNVLLTGVRSDVPELLQVMDIFCLPSVYEGMGRVVLEAQAAGKAVVACDVGGIPDIAAKDKTAVLVPPKDISALTEGILRLVEAPELRMSMAKEAIKSVDERFSAGKMIKDIHALYESMLEARGLRHYSSAFAGDHPALSEWRNMEK